MQRLLEYLNSIGFENLVVGKPGERKIIESSKGKNKDFLKIDTIEESPNKEYTEYSYRISGDNQYNKFSRIIKDLYHSFPIEIKVVKGKPKMYKLCTVIPNNGNFTKEEFDRTELAFALYQAVHSKIEKKNKKYFYKLNEKDNIEISGDCDFNFHIKHLLYLKNIIDEDKNISDSKKEDIINKLFFGHAPKIYSPLNISVMPVTGGLNNTKKNIGNDRFDIFIYALYLYYEHEATSLLLSSGKQNLVYWKSMKKLKMYLDSFDHVYDYCEQIYFLDSELVDELIKSGKKEIDSVARVEEYLELADKVWKKKYNHYQNKENENHKNILKAYKNIDGYMIELKGKNNPYKCIKELKKQKDIK